VGGVFEASGNHNLQYKRKITVNTHSVAQGQLAHIDSFGFLDFVNKRFFYEISKRALDIMTAVVTLGFAIPVMVVIALCIKIDSRGPAIFKQIRIGRNRRSVGRSNGHLHERRKHDLFGKPFEIYKFRTMYVNTNAYATSPKQSSDARLTSVGRLIRKFCLDELPQFWNVLLGDMSLVGPRPEMPQIVKTYNLRERMRLSVKPGITGLWQLKGPRDQMIHENICYDIEYLRHRSFLYDLKIVLQTVLFIFSHNNT